MIILISNSFMFQLFHRLIDLRQIYLECGSFPRYAMAGYLTTVLFHDAVDHGQTESGSVSFVLRSEKRLEYMFSYFVGHTRTVINYGSEYVIACCQCKSRFYLFAAHSYVLGKNSNRAFITNRVLGVNNKIYQYLFYLNRIRFNVP